MKRSEGSVAIETLMIESEALTPAEYLELYELRPHLIESTSILPPRLGESGGEFGKILVRYTRPFYKASTAG